MGGRCEEIFGESEREVENENEIYEWSWLVETAVKLDQ